MNDLFEQFIGYSIKRAFAGNPGYIVSLQDSKHYARFDESKYVIINLRLDVVVRLNIDGSIALDTKGQIISLNRTKIMTTHHPKFSR